MLPVSQAEFLLLMFGYNINLFIHRSGPGLAPTIRVDEYALIVAEKEMPIIFSQSSEFYPWKKYGAFFYFQQKQMF